MQHLSIFSWVLRSFFIGIGGVLLLLGTKQYNKTNFLLENGIATKAIVIDIGKKYVEQPKYTGYVYQPILEYSDLESNKITSIYNINTASTSIVHQLGDTIDIIYYKENPNKQRENSFKGLYLFPFSYSLAGFVFICIGLWFIIDSFRKNTTQ
ncbi:DUF3592 domain-containing protein [Bernardetia sp. ABR2-2B]|uniref:DUF3592 domain-containing protein n=1 Tax=Bernardetia sp. ABR2-2B TaxID=3127472 RepID=UPI0030CF0D2C